MSKQTPAGVIFVAALAAALFAGVATAEQQQQDCPDPPGNPTAGGRVFCYEDADSVDDVVVRLTDFDIATDSTGSTEIHYGIQAEHEGTGGIDIRVTGGSISTKDEDDSAIYAQADKSAGSIRVETTGVDIDTEGQSAHGIAAEVFGTGDLSVYIEGGSIETKAKWARPVRVVMGTASDPDSYEGDVLVDIDGGNFKAEGDWVYLIDAAHSKTGDIDIVVRNAEIEGTGSHNIGVNGFHKGAGVSTIDIRDTDIDVPFIGAYNYHTGTGKMVISVSGGSIDLAGDAWGAVVGWHSGTGGDIDIDLKGGAALTSGAGTGIYAVQYHADSTDDIDISLTGSSSVAMSGADSTGIYAGHVSGDGTIAITVGAGSSVCASDDCLKASAAAGVNGVQVGYFHVQDPDDDQDTTPTGTLMEAAGIGDDGYRRQTVTVNGTVYGGSGEAAGVHLPGGGKVTIGASGSVGAASGVAILAERKLASDPAPRLLVVLRPRSGQKLHLLVRGSIANRSPSAGEGGAGTSTARAAADESGRTVIMVHEQVLFDSNDDEDAPPRQVRYGSQTVALEPGKGLESIGDADAYEYRQVDPTPQPVKQPVAPPKPVAPPPPVTAMPRAAAYEALPGFLLRLDGPVGQGMGPLGAPIWARIGGASGSYEAERSSVGAGYDFDRRSMETGWTVPLDEDTAAWAGARLVSGKADVSAPAGRSSIEALGRGLSAGLARRGPQGFHAAMRFTATWYEIDASSAAQGVLERDAGAFVHSLGLDAGRSVALDKQTRVAARGWLSRTQASVDGFTDAAGSRVSKADAVRLAGGAGVTVETDLARNGAAGGGVTLRGSLGAEWVLDGAETAVTVSGAKLRSEADGARVQLGLGADWRMDGGVTLVAGLSANGLDSGDRILSASFALRTTF